MTVLGNTFQRGASAWLIFLLSTGYCVAQIPNERCIECHSQQEVVLLPVVFGDGEAVSAYIDKDAFLHSAHGELACTECHLTYHPEFRADYDPSAEVDRKLPSRDEYIATVNLQCESCHEDDDGTSHKHIAAVLHPAGKEKTPQCTNCHSAHDTQRVEHDAHLSQVCIECHQDVYERFSASAHAPAMADPPNPDLPACTSCHSGHEGGGKSPTAMRVRMGRPCMGCHGDAALMEKYGISTNVVTTYLQDFHGVSLRFYGDKLNEEDASKYPLVCVDCHGYHDVKSLEDPAAVEELKADLQQACQKCHEDATANFTSAWLAHREPSLSDNILVFLVKMGYMTLIPFVISGLVLHIAFDAIVLPIRNWRKAKREGRSLRSVQHHVELPPGVPKYLPRFSLIQRIEHFLVLVSFAILLLTGLPQRFFEAAWASALVNMLGGIDLVRLVHRGAGIVLTVVAVMHFVRVGAGILLYKWPLSMVPTRKDFEDTIGTLKYQLGFSDVHPKADRFDYGQKFEYWGMILGTIVMVVSGFILIYPMVLSRYLPGQFVAAARMAHSYEAMMALLTIIVWHMYGAKFDRCIFTGKMSSRRLAEHHPLEFERLVKQLDLPGQDSERPTPSSRHPLPAHGRAESKDVALAESP